ncbi:hypothetical protein K3G63_17835 [Hymenobacter sp. HSC-4F20]|uniref:hypothetical protein n=1 Tax=Hymenobacter sp. HSC-4F20 TaxID=2864135 RepID=UPI001C73B1AE|nr:hypothetical protein [Hymenobacter sp. HSC-4F20]MBX0292314.1 hypothetical protein [Hymenobacter sp. HSC-4F20]
MKTKLLLAAALLLGSATIASAQTTPTSTQHGGVVNQSTVPPMNPANPTTNPGTLDQRTPTTASPTQQGVIGTIDQTPQPQRPITEQEMRQPVPATGTTTGTMRRSARQTTAPRRTTTERRTTTTQSATPRP